MSEIVETVNGLIKGGRKLTSIEYDDKNEEVGHYIVNYELSNKYSVTLRGEQNVTITVNHSGAGDGFDEGHTIGVIVKAIGNGITKNDVELIAYNDATEDYEFVILGVDGMFILDRMIDTFSWDGVDNVNVSHEGSLGSMKIMYA